MISDVDKLKNAHNYDLLHLELINKILSTGSIIPCRTGNLTKVLLNQTISWDLANGFPILTFRPIPMKGLTAEIACFLKGITNKEEFEKKGCKYWKQWARPDKIPYTDKDGQEKEKDLGPIYGNRWKFFGADYIDCDTNYNGKGFDQIKYIIDTFNKNPYDRRLLVNAWDPTVLNQMALPPCVYGFQLNYMDERLHMTVLQRSCDLILGVPSDIAGYALLLHLFAQTLKIEPGTITFNLCNCHIYDNHFNIIKENFSNWCEETYPLPKLILDKEATVFNFEPHQASLENYKHGKKVVFPVAV